MSLQISERGAMPSTSADRPMATAFVPPFEIVGVWARPDYSLGTAARPLLLEDWPGVFEGLVSKGTAATFLGAERREMSLDSRAGIVALRQLSGLTWDQLARLFGVARRTLHFWASGRPINAKNEERLHRLLAVLRKADRGSASENRAMLLRDYDGAIPLDLLAAGRLDEFLELVGQGQGRRSPKLAPLSRAAVAARKPLSPEELVDALQDRVHRDLGRGRAGRTARNRRHGRNR